MLINTSGSIAQNESTPKSNSTVTSGLADSPWPMFRQNLNHTGQSPYDTSGNDGKLLWSFLTEGIVSSSPTIDADGVIYIGSLDNNLYAINPDGTQKWNFTTGQQIHSSPAIGSDGTIFVGSFDKNLYAINPDGTEKWRFTTGWVIRSSPTIGPDGTIYVGSGVPLYAINPDGSEKWIFHGSSDMDSSPAIGSDGSIYVGAWGQTFFAVNPDGTEKWKYENTSHIVSSPAISSDGTIYFGDWSGNIRALNPDGTPKWIFHAYPYLAIQSSPAIGSDGTIYVGSRNNIIYAINPDGTEKWRFSTGDFINSSPAIGSDGTIYIGSSDNKMYAINPDGTEKWSFTTGDWVLSSPTIGADGTVYFGSHDGNLYALGTPSQNQPPVAVAGADQIVNEGDSVKFDGSASYDPDGTIESYEWDFDSSNGLWWETGAVPDATGPTPTNIYGDDGIFTATLRVADNEGGLGVDTCNITVQNVEPTVTIESITINVEIGLRVAGRKNNYVGMTLYEDNIPIGHISIERIPGSPDEQMVWIPLNVDFSNSYTATVTYTPEDPPNIGGNPVWIYIKSQDDRIKKIHHTFNVQQTKKKDSDHLNHVEPWEVKLNPHFNGLGFEITTHITDPGSDDETLTFTYGSQGKSVTYMNNPPNPDPYPSPEINPVDIMDTTTLVYEGPGTVSLTVIDDDGGIASDTIDFV